MTKYRSFKRYSSNNNYSAKTILKVGIVTLAGFALYEGCQINKEINETRTQNHHILNSNLENLIKNYEN
ncbi:MAG: hypothetical protein ACMXX9_02290 [Candidatus Woesearchaeota archaeon]